jgi:FO synthase
MERIIRAIGRTPRQRTTLYGEVPHDRQRASFGAAPLIDLPPTKMGPRKRAPATAVAHN